MRQDCRFFESRSYPNGDTVRKCDLDLAPEAPWRCPDGCESYAPRLADVAWSHGSLVTPPTPDAPDALDRDDSDVGALLDHAEEIVNAAAPSIMAEIEHQQARDRARADRSSRGLLGRWFGRFRR